MKRIEGNLSAAGQKIGIVASRFNDFIVNRLIGGAEDCFVRHGGNSNDLTLTFVPGAFEIPLVALKMAESGKYDAVVCLGAVIRGATPISIWLPTRAPRVLQQQVFAAVCLSPMVSSPPTASSRPSSVLEPRLVTKAPTP